MQFKGRAIALAVPGVLAAGLMTGDVTVFASMPAKQAARPTSTVAHAVHTPPTSAAHPAIKHAVHKAVAAAVHKTVHPRPVRLATPPAVSLLSAGSGYRLATSGGAVYSFGVPNSGKSLMGHRLAAPIVSAIPGGKSGGYRMVGRDGGVYATGGAPYYGSAARARLAAPIVAAATDLATGGYWLVGADGGVFAFHAGYFGSPSRVHLASPIVSMAATPTGKGYWLVSRDGGVFAFGDARYHGSAVRHLRSAAVAIAATPEGHGYFITDRTGDVDAFGSARYRYHGSPARTRLSAPIVGMAVARSGQGYWLVSADGGVFGYGNAPYYGSGYVPAPRRPRPAAKRAPATHLVSQPVRIWGPGRGHLEAASIPGYPVEYPPNSTGADISQYQCGEIPAGPASIAVVQVSGGSLNSAPNPCYAQEAAWAGHQMSAYIYMDGLPNPAPAESMNGAAGSCTLTEGGCQAFNFGWNWARYWVGYSRSLGIDPHLWWLDVEAGSGWTDPVINDLVIRGAIIGLESMHVKVGLYSTPYQWSSIAGSMAFPGVPIWIPGAGALDGGPGTAKYYCRSGESFAGGRLQLVQWGYTGNFPGAYPGSPPPYDLDYACPR